MNESRWEKLLCDAEEKMGKISEQNLQTLVRLKDMMLSMPQCWRVHPDGSTLMFMASDGFRHGDRMSLNMKMKRSASGRHLRVFHIHIWRECFNGEDETVEWLFEADLSYSQKLEEALSSSRSDRNIQNEMGAVARDMWSAGKAYAKKNVVLEKLAQAEELEKRLAGVEESLGAFYRVDKAVDS